MCCGVSSIFCVLLYKCLREGCEQALLISGFMSKHSEQDYEIVVQSAFDQLLTDYLNSNHRKRTEVIVKAFHLAKTAHEGAKRKSGEPYILHPIAVASICCNEIGLGSTSIASALLHDVVEDTDYSVADIRDMFGASIARIVDGLTKLSGEILADVMMGKENASAQLENIRHLLLTANEDIRIILIKIADRLHNMRTLGSMPLTKQAKIASETRLFYAPMAERLGMYDIMSELNDLSLKYDHPRQYEMIKREIEESGPKRTELFRLFYAEVKNDLDATGLSYEIQHRMKSIFSIWKKMNSKQLSFSEIYDLYAIRVIFQPTSEASEYDDCFRIYRAISSHFRIKDDRTRDWLTKPKENGYQALHFTVMGPLGEWVEVQIRSVRMHEMAERGLAAHWMYKQNPEEVDDVEQTILNNVRALLSNPGPSASDDYEMMMYKFATQDMLIFTKGGEQVRVPQGFTVLDFAYKLGEKYGRHCLGGKVNHVMVNIDYQLHNGDQVEVLTASKVQPREEWINYATSPYAKRAIRNYLNNTRRQEVASGRNQLEAFLREEGYDIVDLVPHFGSILEYPSADDFYLGILRGAEPLNKELINRLIENRKEERSSEEYKQLWRASDETNVPILKEEDKKKLYTLTARDGRRNYIRALCCKPIFGDEIDGLLNDKNQVEIHKKSCPIAVRFKAMHGDRIIPVSWGGHIHSNFGITLEVEGINQDGFVLNILNAIRKMRIPLTQINFSSSIDRAIGRISVRVANLSELNYLIRKLKDENDILRINLLTNE